MDLLITIAIIAILILALLSYTGRMKPMMKQAPLQRPDWMWRRVSTPDCLYPTPQGLCKQPYHLEL
jgi:hypothetical protein